MTGSLGHVWRMEDQRLPKKIHYQLSNVHRASQSSNVAALDIPCRFILTQTGIHFEAELNVKYCLCREGNKNYFSIPYHLILYFFFFTQNILTEPECFKSYLWFNNPIMNKWPAIFKFSLALLEDHIIVVREPDDWMISKSFTLNGQLPKFATFPWQHRNTVWIFTLTTWYMTCNVLSIIHAEAQECDRQGMKPAPARYVIGRAWSQHQQDMW